MPGLFQAPIPSRSRSVLRNTGTGAQMYLKNRMTRRWSLPESIRFPWRVGLLVLALALPLNLIVLGAIWGLVNQADQSQRTSILYAARSIAAAVDAEFSKYIAQAEALARSSALLDENLDPFEAEARRQFGGADVWVLVTDVNGQQLLNTFAQRGESLPRRHSHGLEAHKRALATGSIVISDLFQAVVSQDWVVGIEVPIFKDGQPFRGLAVYVPARNFYRLLNARDIPSNWLAGISDGQGRLIARVPQGTTEISQLASEGWRATRDRTGIFEYPSLEGDAIIAANTHPSFGSWSVRVAVKKAELQAAAWSTVRWAAICGAILAAASLILVVMLAQQITRQTGHLRQPSAAISQEPGKPIVTGPPKVRLRATQSWPLWIRLTTTVATLGATYLLQLPLEHQVPGQPFLPFFVVVIGTTLAFGPGIGFMSVGLSTLLSVPSFEPLGELTTLTHPADLIKLEIYAILSAGCVVAFANLGDALIAACDESEAFKRLSEKKSLLLSELAHGVANNFAAVAAFISLKATSVSDATAQAVLDEAIEQVQVMGRIHRQLRAGDQDASVDSRTLIRGLCTDLQASLARGQSHAIECAADSRPLCMDHAVLLGLIVNELVTNAIKHAFPDGRAGRIRVGFEVREGQLRISVTDNGIGLHNLGRSDSGMGQDLIRGLSRELGGEPEITSTMSGSSFRLSIPYVIPFPSSRASRATAA